jgi:hypothetical protein
METHVKYFSSQLSLDYVRDETVYPFIKGDAFQVPEVSFSYMHQFFPFVMTNSFQMQPWKLEPIIFSDKFSVFKQHFKKKYPGYSVQTCWRYFTILHLVGTQIHNAEEVNENFINSIQNSKFYSAQTLEHMEAKYLKKIAGLKQRVQDTSEFDVAATEVAIRATMKRQSSRSTRDGKIKNH